MYRRSHVVQVKGLFYCSTPSYIGYLSTLFGYIISLNTTDYAHFTALKYKT